MKKTACVRANTRKRMKTDITNCAAYRSPMPWGIFRLFFLSGILFCFTLTGKPGVSHHERNRAPAFLEGVAPPTYYCSRNTQMPEGKSWDEHKVLQDGNIEVKETSRIVYHLDMQDVTGRMVSGRMLKPLPVGTTLDSKRGIFYWLPGPGFIGRYRFLFISANGKEKLLSIRIVPRFGQGPGVTRINSRPLDFPSSNGEPFGVFSTPIDGSTVRSSVPVTGWALDDVGVDSVKIYRQEGSHLVYIGDAVFVEGARPDVETAYPGYPNNSAAGWGYMMLTNFLPNRGNGTFTLHAIARDTNGNSVTLGTKTIICDNANAVKPFGAIDTPGQGGSAAGTNYRIQGWALTPPHHKIPVDGSTIKVIIDGSVVGNVNYNIYRPDIAGLFPGYLNSGGAHGYLAFDTTAYANGLHTIMWVATDNAGNSDGIGSRYFYISNSGNSLSVSCRASPLSGESPLAVNFTCTPTGGNGAGSYTYRWTFGDSNTSTLQNPSHTYQSAGTYTAAVTVTSGTNTANCSKTITVTGTAVIYDTIIVGAGIAGLSSAYFLKNKKIKVLEKENRVGGRTISGTYEGFTYAKGTEYLGEPEYALKRIVNELNLDAVEIPEPMDGRYYNEWFYYGYDELEEMMVEYSSQAEYNRFVRLLLSYYNSGELEDVPEFNLNSQLAALDTITAREWFISNGFSSIYQEVYNVSSRGLFGASIDEISALSFLPELAFDYVDDSASNPYARRQAVEGSGSYSFKTGITEVTGAIANHLGDKIQLNSTVKNVTLENDIYTVSYEAANKNTVAIQSKTVILAVPSSIALQVASSVLSAEQKSIMRQISYAPYITVTLFSDEPIFNKTFDLAVPDNYFFTDIYDSTWVQRAYDNSLTNKKKYIICIYTAAQSYKDETLLGLSDSKVLANIYARLDQLFPGASNKVTGYDIHRFSYGYPVMTKGAYTRLTRLHKITTGSLQLAGDYMVYPTFEAAVESGSIAAEKIKEELKP